MQYLKKKKYDFLRLRSAVIFVRSFGVRLLLLLLKLDFSRFGNLASFVGKPREKWLESKLESGNPGQKRRASG